MSEQFTGALQEVVLGEHAHIKARIGWRGLSSKEYIDSGGALLGAGNHISNGRFDWSRCDRITLERYEESPEIALRETDVVISKDGTIGRVAYIDKLPQVATINGTMMLVRVHGDRLDPHFVYHYLQGEKFQSLIQERISGSSIPHIFQRDMVGLKMEIPPLPEQKKIAEILSGIDTQRQALAKKAATASMLRNALGEKIFSSLDGERVALGELCNPKQWQTISANQLTTSGYPVYGANGKIGYFTEYNHKEPVLAVTCRGATCGNLTLIPAFSYVTGNSMCLDNPRKDTSPEYLFQFLAWRGLRDVISGSAQPQITRSPLQAVEVVLPSKEKQDKIVSALQSVNNTEQLVNIALSRLDILKKAIAADLLSGRKRVSV